MLWQLSWVVITTSCLALDTLSNYWMYYSNCLQSRKTLNDLCTSVLPLLMGGTWERRNHGRKMTSRHYCCAYSLMVIVYTWVRLLSTSMSHLSSLKSFLRTSRALCRKFWMVFPFFICRWKTHKDTMKTLCYCLTKHTIFIPMNISCYRSSFLSVDFCVAAHQTLPWQSYDVQNHPSSWM